MRVTHDGITFEIMGDPHLGRRFVDGVPLARRGEREASIRKDFRDSLMAGRGAGYHVNLGDTFDRVVVDYDTLRFAIQSYHEAIRANPETAYVVLRGNHDINRDLQGTSAFDLFADAISPEARAVEGLPYFQSGAAFFGWHPTRGAGELAAELQTDQASIAFGHWDTDPRSGTHNLCPTRILRDRGVTVAYTGHIHQPARFTREGLVVIQVGSLQPYAHGEGDTYLTVTLSELREDPSLALSWKDKVVRILVPEGESVPPGLLPDCLQLSVERQVLKQHPDAEINGEVSLGTFNLTEIFDAETAHLSETVKVPLEAQWKTVLG
jgi:predicted phosphodiesterase